MRNRRRRCFAGRRLDARLVLRRKPRATPLLYPVEDLRPTRAEERADVSRSVSRFARYFGRSPEQLGREDIGAYQLHLVEQGVSWSLFDQAVCALRFCTAYAEVSGRSRTDPVPEAREAPSLVAQPGGGRATARTGRRTLASRPFRCVSPGT